MNLLMACLAAAGAAFLAAGRSTPSYEYQLIRVAVQQSFGDAASEVLAEQPEIQALLLDYADNEQLVLKTRVPLLRYPELAGRILPIYGMPETHTHDYRRYGTTTLFAALDWPQVRSSASSSVVIAAQNSSAF
jgi:hypothetical protein